MTMISIVVNVESKTFRKTHDSIEMKPKMSKRASANGTKAPKKASTEPFKVDDDVEIKPKMSKRAYPKGTMAPTKKSIKKERSFVYVADEEFGMFSMSMSLNDRVSKKVRSGQDKKKGGSTASEKQPSPQPTTPMPTPQPTLSPTVIPSDEPSLIPTPFPSSQPITDVPTVQPTLGNSLVPFTDIPTTSLPTPSVTALFNDDDSIGRNNTNSTGDDDTISNNSTVTDDDATNNSNNGTVTDDDVSIPDTSVGGNNRTNVTPFIAGVVGLFVLIIGTLACFRKKKRSGASRPRSEAAF